MNHTAFSKNEENRSSWTNGIPDTFVFKDGLEDPPSYYKSRAVVT